jgi:hypothetical protein
MGRGRNQAFCEAADAFSSVLGVRRGSDDDSPERDAISHPLLGISKIRDAEIRRLVSLTLNGEIEEPLTALVTMREAGQIIDKEVATLGGYILGNIRRYASEQWSWPLDELSRTIYPDENPTFANRWYPKFVAQTGNNFILPDPPSFVELDTVIQKAALVALAESLAPRGWSAPLKTMRGVLSREGYQEVLDLINTKPGALGYADHPGVFDEGEWGYMWDKVLSGANQTTQSPERILDKDVIAAALLPQAKLAYKEWVNSRDF